MFDPTRKYELSVRPLGRTQADEYLHNGDTWIEGRDGNSYTIDISNHTYGRVLFIVSVDGLDVIEGKSAGLNSQGYVLDPNSTLSIPGWKLNNKEAAEFYFSRGQDSYVNTIGGNISNTGVIGAMAFPEYVTPSYNLDVYRGLTGTYVTPSYTLDGYRGSTGTGIWPYTYTPTTININNVSWNPMSVPINTCSINTAGSATILQNSLTASVAEVKTAASARVTQDVGTGFGNYTEWNTTQTTFNKANPTEPDGYLAIYYNTARNLEKMGIKLRRKNNPGYTANPFPGYTSSQSSGCVIPPGWKK